MGTSVNGPIKILMVAAEASSALYAQRLLEYWKSRGVAVEAFGIGSRQMEALGFECLGRSEELAVVGLQEVLAHRKEIFAAFDKLIQAARERKPHIVLLLDYPDFNFRLAKKLHGLKEKTFQTVYYISPQIWAWRKSRVKLVKKYIDRMLVLFPFEPEFYRSHGVEVDFVGHPLLDELERHDRSSARILRLREKFGVKSDQLVLGLMPGSRRSEIRHLFSTQLETAKILHQKFPEMAVTVLVAPGMEAESLKGHLPSGWDVPIQFIKLDPFDMVAICDVLLVASGTATLVVGLMERPMVIMYKMNPLTVKLARLIMKRPKFFGMANLILDREVSPEKFQEEANPQELARTLAELLESENLRKQKSRELAEIAVRLGQKGATTRVAQILENLTPARGRV